MAQSQLASNLGVKQSDCEYFHPLPLEARDRLPRSNVSWLVAVNSKVVKPMELEKAQPDGTRRHLALMAVSAPVIGSLVPPLITKVKSTIQIPYSCLPKVGRATVRRVPSSICSLLLDTPDSKVSQAGPRVRFHS